jgi:hypothetical protein
MGAKPVEQSNQASGKSYTFEELQSMGAKPVLSKLIEPTTESQSSGGFLGFVAPPLPTLPQAIGLWLGSRGMAESAESISSNMQKNAELSMQTLKKLQTTTDETERARLSKLLKDIVKTNQELSGYMGEVIDPEGLTKATAIKIPYGVADIPGLSTDPKRAAQQIIGRSISQIGVSTPGFSPTGMGAIIGAGRGLEAGKDLKGIAAESALTALMFKGGSAFLGGMAKTSIGQKALASPLGKTALKLTEKIYSPFMVKPSTPNTFGAEVDKQVANFGKAIDKLYSPSTYLKPLEVLGQKAGLLKTPEEKLQDAYKQVEGFWQGYKDGYKRLVKYDKNSPRILAREGVGATQSGNSLITTEGQEVLKMKIGAEHKVLNEALRKSGLYADVGEFKTLAEAQIIANTKAGEQVKALSNFRREWQAFVNQNKPAILENKMPLELLNDFKSYSWSNGYASKIAPKLDSINAKANRLAGNTAKRYINRMAQGVNKDLAEGIVFTNQRSGELQEALRFLEAMNGSKIAYGKMGRHFARLLGAIVGSSGGALGSVAGTLTADQLIAILQNPKYSIGQAMMLIQQAQKINPKIMNQLSEYIYQQSITKPITQKVLSKGTTIFGQEYKGGKGKLFSQEEVKQFLTEQGTLDALTSKVGEAKLKGKSSKSISLPKKQSFKQGEIPTTINKIANKGLISKEAEKWASGWIGLKEDLTTKITPQIEKELSQFKPTKPVKLYRGVSPDAPKNAPFSSWSYNREAAEMHAGDEGKVISRIVKPKEILTDFSEMPSDLQTKLGVIDEEMEVLVKNSI